MKPRPQGAETLRVAESPPSSSMVFGGAEETDVVGLVQVPHELVDELLAWEAPDPPVFRRDDDVEPPERHGDLAFPHQAAKCGPGCHLRDPEGFASLRRREVIAPEGGELVDVLGGRHGGRVSSLDHSGRK